MIASHLPIALAEAPEVCCAFIFSSLILYATGRHLPVSGLEVGEHSNPAGNDARRAWMLCRQTAFSRGGATTRLAVYPALVRRRQTIWRSIMKDIFGILGKALEKVRPNGTAALAAARRELRGAAGDLRNIYARNWSDRGHL